MFEFLFISIKFQKIKLGQCPVFWSNDGGCWWWYEDEYELLPVVAPGGINLVIKNLYCWSICAFSIRLSFARRFWNQILICASESFRPSASSNRLPREMYSLVRNSCSSFIVCAPLKVVLWRLGRPSLRLLRATAREFFSEYKLIQLRAGGMDRKECGTAGSSYQIKTERALIGVNGLMRGKWVYGSVVTWEGRVWRVIKLERRRGCV